MFLSIARLIVILAGPIIGYLNISPDAKGILLGTAVAVGVLLVEFIIQKVRLDDIIAAGIGLILGLVMAKLLDYSISLMESPAVEIYFIKYSLLIKIVFAYIGMLIAVKKKSEIYLLDQNISLAGRKRVKAVYVLDTSVIIDGRLMDILFSGFLKGIMVVPEFIIKEIQMLADSEDQLRRTKGRRALDFLKRMKEEAPNIEVRIHGVVYPNIENVDDKLLKVTEELSAELITTDFNLNKVAKLRGINVLNINQLANALKPVVLPGEVLSVFLLKEGKERRQGVGYLDDGTMVVVEDGRNFIGQKKDVIVHSILQTDAGRMVFGRVEK